jgi:uncharacterized protein (DUF58 family)
LDVWTFGRSDVLTFPMSMPEPITAPTSRRYLRIQDLRRLRHMEFASRRLAEGRLTGRHDSRQRGRSIEFNDYRQYMPGDELADLDWKVYGRSDRLYVKLYEHETDLTVNVLVDASASMDYAGLEGGAGLRDATGLPALGSRLSARRRGVKPTGDGRQPTADSTISKFDQACFIAAAISFLVAKQRDRVLFGLAQGGLQSVHRPASSMRHLLAILEAMEQARPGGEAAVAGAIEQLCAVNPRKGVLVLISDLLDDREGILRALDTYRARGSEIIVFHVLHADELRLPEAANGMFIDSESGARVRVNVDDVRAAYEERMRSFLRTWAEACRRRGIDYNLVSTAESYYKPLERYLLRRSCGLRS